MVFSVTTRCSCSRASRATSATGSRGLQVGARLRSSRVEHDLLHDAGARPAHRAGGRSRAFSARRVHRGRSSGARRALRFAPPALPGFLGNTGPSATPTGPACPSRDSMRATPELSSFLFLHTGGSLRSTPTPSAAPTAYRGPGSEATVAGRDSHPLGKRKRRLTAHAEDRLEAHCSISHMCCGGQAVAGDFRDAGLLAISTHEMRRCKMGQVPISISCA